MQVAIRHDTILRQGGHNDDTIAQHFSLPAFKETVVGYFAGYVVSMVKTQLNVKSAVPP